ncbi:MAG: reverse transcriptase family protein [Planctomycetota bacterium]
MGLFDWLSNVFGGQRQPGSGLSPIPGSPRPTKQTQSRSKPTPPKPRTLDGLDAEQFAPLDDDEAKRQAKALGRPLWTNTWLGRRDLIPPVTDKRTVLIDRMMVADGLATPEELAEIHAVGAEMDRLRPDLAHAADRANQAVARDRDQRAKLKAEKKQVAAEKKRLHAEAVAERKRNDIVFLGRGVSRGLADRVSDEEKLKRLSLPLLKSPASIALALGCRIETLRWLAYHSEAAERIHYVQFTTRKKSGGVRVLASPHKKLRRAQRWVLEAIVSKVAIHDAAHGFVTGRSTVTNAAPHVGQQVVVNADLKDFFPSITFPRVEGFFRGLGYSGAVATILALLVTECPRQRVNYAGKQLWVATGPRSLPQGACTSPALSNAIAWRLDKRLAGIAAKLDWAYTRYADDLTFSTSGDNSANVGYLLARLRHIVADEGFALNRQKTRVQRRNARQSVTGVVVNERVGVPRKTVRRLRSILHNAQKTGLAAQNRNGHPDFEAWLRGMVAYVRMVNPKQAAPLVDALEKLRP